MRRANIFLKKRISQTAVRFGLLGFLLIPAGITQADVVALGGLEAYSQDFLDVTRQSDVGNWTKTDSPNPVAQQGELVTSGAFGSPPFRVEPRSGEVLLDLRTEAQYVTGGDGADYSYALNQADFGGVVPSTLRNGTIDLNYFICPDTFSADANNGNGGFISEGIYQRTDLRNGDGDILVSIGMFALGNQNSPEVQYSIDGINWLSTGLEADSGTWTEVELQIDLDNQTSRVGFTDSSSNTFESEALAWSPTITDTSVQALNFQMDNGVGKNFFDDFSFNVTAVAVPEPSNALVLSASLLVLMRRKRRPSVR